MARITSSDWTNNYLYKDGEIATAERFNLPTDGLKTQADEIWDFLNVAPPSGQENTLPGSSLVNDVVVKDENLAPRVTWSVQKLHTLFDTKFNKVGDVIGIDDANPIVNLGATGLTVLNKSNLQGDTSFGRDASIVRDLSVGRNITFSGTGLQTRFLDLNTAQIKNVSKITMIEAGAGIELQGSVNDWLLNSTSNTGTNLSLLASSSADSTFFISNGNSGADVNLSVDGSIASGGHIKAAAGAFIANSDSGDFNLSGSNIDHLWYDDNTNTTTSAPGTWHFCADTTYKSAGNATIQADSIVISDTGKVSNLNADRVDGYHASITSVASTVAVRNASQVLASRTLQSTVGTGTAPFAVASTTKVTNLNADRVDGYTTSLTAVNSTVAVRNSSGVLESKTFKSTISTGTAPFTVISATKVSNLNADFLDGVSSGSFLRSDATDIKTAGNLTFNDNIYLRIGTGGDVEHFWNGSHYYTDINGGANWYLRDGNSSNATRFTFDIDLGKLTATGDIVAFSDRKLKTNIQNIPNAIDKIKQINGVTYNRIDIPQAGKQTGVIAQDVIKVLPEAVSTNIDAETKEETLAVAYGNMVGLLIEGIKEQQNTIDALEDRIKNLEGK